MSVPKQKRRYMDDRAEECIEVGYGKGSTYRLMPKKTKRLSFKISRLSMRNGEKAMTASRRRRPSGLKQQPN